MFFCRVNQDQLVKAKQTASKAIICGKRLKQICVVLGAVDSITNTQRSETITAREVNIFLRGDDQIVQH